MEGGLRKIKIIALFEPMRKMKISIVKIMGVYWLWVKP